MDAGKAPAKQGMDAPWRVGVMARLKNRKQAAVWTKAGPGNLCSSLLGCSLPRKKKPDLIVVIFCSDMTLWGSYPRCPSQKSPALNATGRLSSLQQKTFAPALWGILPWGPSLRQHPCWLGRVFCLRFGALERSFCAHHRRQRHLQNMKKQSLKRGSV